MSEILSSIFSDIANSIRQKLGTSDTFTPAQMSEQINNIPGMGLAFVNDKKNEPIGEYVFGLKNVSSVNVKYAAPISSANLVESPTGNLANNTESFHDDSGPMTLYYDYIYIGTGNGRTNADYLFYNCQNFNCPVIVGNGITSMNNTFFNSKFNYPINIPGTVKYMNWTFWKSNFNQPINIPYGVLNLHGTFGDCKNYNAPINISNSITDMAYAFQHCTNFNQTINIPNSVTNMYGTFYNCTNFNKTVSISDNVKDMAYAFYNCYKLDQTINIPSNVTNLSYCFFNCAQLGYIGKMTSIDIPAKVTNVSYMLKNCQNIASPMLLKTATLYFKNANALTNTIGLLEGWNNQRRINIRGNNRLKFMNTAASNSITRTAITWTNTTNYSYNTTYNIYVYNNYTG